MVIVLIVWPLFKSSEYTIVHFGEIELTSDEMYWLITLGHPRSLLGPAQEYKVIKVDAKTGEVLSMKMRIVEWTDVNQRKEYSVLF